MKQVASLLLAYFNVCNYEYWRTLKWFRIPLNQMLRLNQNLKSVNMTCFNSKSGLYVCYFKYLFELTPLQDRV